MKAFGFDTDHDGKQNIVFGSETNPANMQFWEHIGYDRYVLEDTAQWSQLYDVGYLDSDSLVDIVGNRNAIWPYPLYVYESPTYNSNPTSIVWQDSGFMNIAGGYITDLDQDGLKEMLFSYMDGTLHICVYENTGDNQYSCVWQDTLHGSGLFVNGDFDVDGRIEFITGNATYGWVYAWESVGDNNYQFIFSDTLPWANNADIFSGNDMDGNGKPEFLFTSVHYFYGIAWLYLYETLGDNYYNFFLIDSITGLPGSITEQASSCGDFDADGVEEIVWSTFNQWHIYKAIGVHQYQKIYSSAETQHDITVMSIYDLNGNGYPEIIDSWAQNGIPYLHGTTIWEIEGVRLHQPNGGEILHPGQQYPITWEKFDPPGADSFALFISYDNGYTYDTIVTSIMSNDTSYLWTVPDTVSDSCKIMIWAYGPPRPSEQVPRGTAWDFSDSVFTATDEEVAENANQPNRWFLEISQNPAISKNFKIYYSIPKTTVVRLSIYNSSGRLEKVLVDEPKNAGVYQTSLEPSLPSGVYFVKLITNSAVLSRKCVILERL